jgi:hypothetical protein
VVAACGTPEQPEPGAQQLVPQLSELPAGYDAVQPESFPVLSSCTAVGREPDLNEALVVARAQQARIARTLGEGRR